MNEQLSHHSHESSYIPDFIKEFNSLINNETLQILAFLMLYIAKRNKPEEYPELALPVLNRYAGVREDMNREYASMTRRRSYD